MKDSSLSISLHVKGPCATPARLLAVGDDEDNWTSIDYYLAVTTEGLVWKPFHLRRGLKSPPVLEQIPDDALDLQSIPRVKLDNNE